MSLGINNFNSNVSYTNAFVSGTEATQASQTLFAAASKVSSSAQATPSFTSVQPQNANLGLVGTDVATVKQIATNQAGLNVNLSSNAVSALEVLRSQAAQNLSTTVVKSVEGKLHVPTDFAERVPLNEVFSASVKPEVFNVANMNKDRKGSNPFAFTAPASEETTEEREPLNIFA